MIQAANRDLNIAYAFFERNWNLTRRYIGWEVVRLPVESAPPETDDLEALANAVREAALPPPGEPVGQGVEVGRRGHLRVLRSSPEERDRLR